MKSPTANTARRRACGAALGACVLLLGACQGYQRDKALIDEAVRGDFATARINAGNDAVAASDRDKPMHDMKELIAALADGVPAAAAAPAQRVYDLLRTAGINEGSGAAAFFTTEDSARVYKGEPFEQAMAYCYIGMLDGIGGDWGNLRAGVNNSLFTLRDFAGVPQARSNSQAAATSGSGRSNKSQGRPARRNGAQAQSQSNDAAQVTTSESGEDERTANVDPKDPAVVGAPVPSDFALGYVLKAIAARQLNEPDEMRTCVEQVKQINAQLGPLADLIATAQYNTVLVVDFGLGPAKVATGDDRTIIRFQDQTPSTTDDLIVISQGQRGSYPVVIDLNRLARDAKWTNLEPMRRAKSAIGTGLLVAGATATAVGADRRNNAALAAGLGAMAAGALLKASSYADTRQVELMPQRVYVALLQLPREGAAVDLQVGRFPESRVVLPAVTGGDANKAKLHYVRLPIRTGAWATSGQTYYPNDDVNEGTAPTAPYILGGTCVRTPSDTVLESYHRAGVLTEFSSVIELEQLYRDEGIKLIAQRPQGAVIGAHVLESGTWLFTPTPGSTGYARLYGQAHPAYAARSARVRELQQKYGPIISRLRAQLATAVGRVGESAPAPAANTPVN